VRRHDRLLPLARLDPPADELLDVLTLQADSINQFRP
jgi:hypothetical protein